jgi:hypothetical protein
MLVTLPESTPVSEVIETAFALEDRVGVALGPVIVDAVDDGPPLDEEVAAGLGRARLEAARFRNRRRDGQRRAIDRLTEQLPLPLLRLPQVLTATLEYADIVDLSGHLLAAIEALP